MSPFLVKWMKFSLVAIVGCGFVAMAIYAFVKRDEIRSAQIDPPLISAPEEPVKRRPEQPGGMEIPNRDKMVFDLLENDSSSTNTAGGGFAPLGAETVADNVSPSDAPADLGTVEEVNPVAAPAQMQPVTATAPVQVAQVVPATAAPAVASASAVQPVAAAQPAAAVQEKPVAVKEEPKPVEAKKDQPKEEPAAVGGKWGVQLAAVASKADGQKAIAKLTAQHTALKGLSGRVAVTPDGKKFRVQFVGLKDRAAAVALCAKVQPCFPVAPK